MVARCVCFVVDGPRVIHWMKPRQAYGIQESSGDNMGAASRVHSASVASENTRMVGVLTDTCVCMCLLES